MTIISNNCSASWTYKLNNIQYNHPFMWSISDVNYVDWLDNFYDFDYENVEFDCYDIYDIHIKKNSTICYAKIDNKCTTHYMHYILDKEERYDDLSYYSPNILEHCKKKYFNRINRIKKQTTYFLIDMYRSDIKINCHFPFCSVPDVQLIELSERDNVFCYTSSFPEDEHVRNCFRSDKLTIFNDRLYDSTRTIAEHFTKNILPTLKD